MINPIYCTPLDFNITALLKYLFLFKEYKKSRNFIIIYFAVPYIEKEITKLYYSIGEVSDMFQVNTSLIRFWEKEFDIIKPKKNKKGNRMFTQNDVENFHLIFHLVKERGFTLQGAKEQLKTKKDETIHQHEIIKKLQKIRSFLLEMKEELQ